MAKLPLAESACNGRFLMISGGEVGIRTDFAGRVPQAGPLLRDNGALVRGKLDLIHIGQGGFDL